MPAEDSYMVSELLIPEIVELLAAGKADEVAEAMAQLRDPEVADVLRKLTEEQRALAFAALPPQRAADVFGFLEQPEQEAIVEHVDDGHMATVFNEMDTDDRVEFFADAPDDVVDAALARMEPEERKETEKILEYPEESVGRLIVTDFLTLRAEWTVARALDHIRANGEEVDTLQTLYVVDDQDRLLDMIRLRRLVLAGADELCQSLCEGQVVSLNELDDREEAVRVMERYDLPVLPVVNQAGVLVGIVTFDDMADVAEEEATEDFHKLGGMAALDQGYMVTGLFEMVKKRVGWLAILFAAGLLTVMAMSGFEEHIDKLPLLAVFVPLIIATGGNSGFQAATLMTRAFALKEVQPNDWRKVFVRELASGVVLGGMLAVLGFVLATLVGMWMYRGDEIVVARSMHIGMAVGLSVIGVVVFGNMVGSLLPFVMQSIGADPATSSTPFVATIVDVCGLLIYFSIATAVLGLG